jgi:hypothetical protein
MDFTQLTLAGVGRRMLTGNSKPPGLWSGDHRGVHTQKMHMHDTTPQPKTQEAPPARRRSATRAAIEHLRTSASLLRSAGWEQSADAVEALADDLAREM